MKKSLVHFIEWKKIAVENIGNLMADAASWGVKEIVAHPVWFREEGNFIPEITGKMAAHGLTSPACHALWGAGNDCVQRDEAAHQRMIARHSRFLDQLAEIGVKTYTIHLGMPDYNEIDRDFDRIRRTVDELLPALHRNGIALALENSAESMEIIEKLAALSASYKDELVGMCFDSGHANCYQTGIKATFEVMKNEIVTCHLHDNYGSFDDHNPPGEGNTDWKELTALLDSAPRMLHAETESGFWDQQSWDKFVRAVENH